MLDSVGEMPGAARKTPNRRKLKKPMKSATIRVDSGHPAPSRYKPPVDIERRDLKQLIAERGYPLKEDSQLNLLREGGRRDVSVYCAGDLALLQLRSVAIVGAREASREGKSRSYKLAKELVAAEIAVVSGLAKGIDTAAHFGAIDNGGKTIAVIGTPLNKAYPAENTELQERIYREHLLISPFEVGERTFRSSFPKRNRVMALLSDATVIVEASDTSGSLHQAAECVNSGRWLLIMKSVLETPSLTWPKRFLGKPKVIVMTNTQEIIEAIA